MRKSKGENWEILPQMWSSKKGGIRKEAPKSLKAKLPFEGAGKKEGRSEFLVRGGQPGNWYQEEGINGFAKKALDLGLS